MPARSTFVTIINNTSLELDLQKTSLSHGEWKTLQAESAGIMTGDQGVVIYSSDAGIFTFNFDNPWSGSNDYDQSAPDGYTINRSGGGGDNASVTWTIDSN
ncbi:hypothetical protein FIE12Z_1303 [Fusarium flagelliforme]|uniref:Crystal protein ET79 n=1 Tax=Fusarium flagelliforme TaxID=2675880 RepID=A0A395N3F6_9HYPO|nr:hypothetical protein FIE12Z_1303 [Fusarium flagelliforme]